LQPEGVRTTRALDLDLNGSLDEVISRLSAGGLSAHDQTEHWAKLMRQRQNIVEERIDNLFKGMSKMSTTMQGAEAMY
jgi:hypothetical protein